MKPTFHFHIRTDRALKNGDAPIYFEFYISKQNRIRKETGKYVSIQKQFYRRSQEALKKLSNLEREKLYCWDNKAQRVTRGGNNADNINAFLNVEKAKYNAIVAKHELLNRPLTIESFAQEFLKPEGNNNFFEYFLTQIDRRKNVLANETYRSYLSIITKIQKFRPNFQIGDIDYKFLCDLETYMLSPVSKKGLGNNQATASKSLRTLRTLVLMAIKNGDLLEEYYPFKNFKLNTLIRC